MFWQSHHAHIQTSEHLAHFAFSIQFITDLLVAMPSYFRISLLFFLIKIHYIYNSVKSGISFSAEFIFLSLLKVIANFQGFPCFAYSHTHHFYHIHYLVIINSLAFDGKSLSIYITDRAEGVHTGTGFFPAYSYYFL